MEKPQEIPTDTDTTDNNLSIIRDDVLHVEELGCGVSVGGRPTEKQEWSFTLYDLDGQGRVTKEEVAQLLKSLYDAVGSSISLPQAGTKSLKLHLTVSPDHSNRPDETACPTKTDTHRDLNCKECNSQKDKMPCQKDINTKLNNGALTNKLNFKDVGPLRVDLPNNLSKADKDEVHRTVKKLSPSEQRQLAELVEINMQKNQERRARHLESRSHHNGKHKHPSLRLSHVLENPDRRSYYSDLAGIENPSSQTMLPSPDRVGGCAAAPQKVRTKSRSSGHKRTPDKTVSQTIKDSLQPDSATRKGEPKHSSPVRDVSKSQSAPNGLTQKGHSTKSKAVISMSPTRHGTLSPNRYCCTKSSSPRKDHTQSASLMHTDDPNDRSKSHEQTTEQFTASADKPVLPKHRRHKQKEKNHVRAMLQVAQWIEKEHVSPSESVEDVSVEKYEHHHFHEHHHHHHYHYYHQT